MKKSTLMMMVALIAVVCLSLSFNTTRTSALADRKSQMMADWERAKAYTKEYLDAASEETISAKPMPEMRTFGQQMLHLSEANYGISAAATGKTNPITMGQLENQISMLPRQR